MGRPRVFSDEERRERRKGVLARYYAENRERIVAQSGECQRKRLAERAIADGREPGRRGHYHRPPILSEDEKRESHRVANSKYASTHRAEQRARYLADAATIKERSRLHKERLRVENPEHYKALLAAGRHNRRARLKGLSGRHSAKDIRWLWAQQKGRCVFCLEPLPKKGFHVDHHEPLALGGSNDRSNLRLLHRKCNQEKHARDPIEYAREHGLLVW